MTSAAAEPGDTAVELPFDRLHARRQSRALTLVTRAPEPGRPTDGSTALAAWAVVLARYLGGPHVALAFLSETGLAAVELEVDPQSPFSEVVRRIDASHGTAPEAATAAVFVPAELDLEDPALSGTALALQLTDTGELRVRFDTSKFEQRTADRIAGHLIAVLDAVGNSNGDVPVGEIAIATAEELALLAEWNETGTDFGNETLVSLFEWAVDEWPSEVALTYEGRSLTYREFATATTAVVRALKAAGVEAGSMVGVLCERSIEMVAALHGIVGSGAAYVPLDPEYPANRIEYMIGETGMTVVIADARFRSLVPDGVTVLDTAAIATPVDGDPTVWRRPSPDDVAYVIYTSGSTGRPKGVANAHQGIANRLMWMQDHYGIGPSNVVLQKTPFSFDVSVWEFFWPLQAGARLVVARPGGHKDPAYLIETINQHAVDTIHFVPSMLRLFLDHPAAGTCTSLKRVICSGEALTRDLQDRFFSLLPDAELHNLYGPTEAAVDVTAWQCKPDDELPVVPIGRPIANTTIDILDDRMRAVPIGVPGELYIGGVQVAVGYVNRPNLTEERFLADPNRPGGRLYRTGDLARWLPNGTVDFLGRLDHQVKIRGQRVELGEIEATLGEHPAVLEAAVTVDRSGGDARLVAHLMWRSEPASDASLRTFLAQRLPAYMLPARFVSHEALPLTTSGKVDRKLLVDDAPERVAVGSDETSSDPLEHHLLRIWRSILGRSDIGPRDRVFDLGATSLQAAAFVNEVQRFLGEFVYVVTVFTSPTVAEYAAFLRDQYRSALGDEFGGVVTAAAPLGKVDEAAVADLEAVVPRPGPYPLWAAGAPNPPAAFILAPPRSGTTLMRVMLAGHSHLFAAPELQLLGFDDLAVRHTSLSGRFSPWLEGAIRAVMDLDACSAQEAIDFVARHERNAFSSKDFFRLLQERTGGRLLVDKSPSYSLDLEVLRNAEVGFEGPLYIHLVRDPRATSRSFESYHMDQILYLEPHDFPPRTLGELVWTVSHRNILAFSQEVDDERVLRVRFENLVTEPRPIMGQVADFLGIPFEDSLLHPYDNLERKMVDGLHAASTPMGDTRLLEKDRIDPEVAWKWSAEDEVFELGEPTLRIARALGYQTDRVDEMATRRREFAASSRQRRTRSRTE